MDVVESQREKPPYKEGNAIARRFQFDKYRTNFRTEILAGVEMQARYINENGELPRANQTLTADAIVTNTGAILGTSPLLKIFVGKARDVPIITRIPAAISTARFTFMTLRFG